MFDFRLELVKIHSGSGMLALATTEPQSDSKRAPTSPKVDREGSAAFKSGPAAFKSGPAAAMAPASPKVDREGSAAFKSGQAAFKSGPAAAMAPAAEVITVRGLGLRFRFLD